MQNAVYVRLFQTDQSLIVTIESFLLNEIVGEFSA